MSRIVTEFSKVERPYTGIELRPHFLLSELGLKGSALGAFIGPCQVNTQSLVDWENRLKQDRIEARWMIHFLGEFFGMTLREGVLLQRLLVGTMGEILNGELLRSGWTGGRVLRSGDDLYLGSRKLSVSVATSSPVSQLLHIGINIDPEGAPVPAIGLAEMGVMPETWIPAVLETFQIECSDMEWACSKVKPVI